MKIHPLLIHFRGTPCPAVDSERGPDTRAETKVPCSFAGIGPDTPFLPYVQNNGHAGGSFTARGTSDVLGVSPLSGTTGSPDIREQPVLPPKARLIDMASV